MALDTREKRQNAAGVGRPYLRGKLPVGATDEQSRIASGLGYGGNPLNAAVNATAIGIGTEVLAESGTASARGTGGAGSPWVGYEPRGLYAPRLVKKRVPAPVQIPVPELERVDARAVGIGVETYVRTGLARARGTVVVHARAVGRSAAAPVAAVGQATGSASAAARGTVGGRSPADRERDDEDALRWILSVAA